MRVSYRCGLPDHTPDMERLAREGAKCTNAYAQLFVRLPG